MFKRSIVVVVLLSSGIIRAQDDCAALLRHGIRDYVTEVASNSNFSQSQRQMCDKYQEVNKQSISGSAEVDVPLSFGANVKMSADSFKSLGKSLCENSNAVSDSSALVQKASSVISPAALTAYTQCQTLNGLFLKTFVKFDDDDTGTRSVTISMYYAPPPGLTTTQQEVRGIVLNGFNDDDCHGDLWLKWKASATRTLPLDGATQTIVCNRQVGNEPVQDAGRPVLAKLSTVTITTSAGPAIGVTLAPIFPQPPEWRLHIGEIVSSMLGPQEFQRAYGAGWVLADGRSVAGSAYAKVMGNETVPDLRGVFLRGKNYDRDPKTGNEAGDSRVGAFQPDGIKAHKHPLAGIDYDGTSGIADALTGKTIRRISETLPQAPTPLDLGLETKPRNVTVNFYIRVN